MRHFLDSRWPSVAMMFFLMCTIGIYATGCQREDTINKRSLVTRTPEICSPGEAVDTDGQRRLALIVGVGEYKNANIPDLKGPPNDAGRFYELLTGKTGTPSPSRTSVCFSMNRQLPESSNSCLTLLWSNEPVKMMWW
jgi:hypothetical protein